jgi:hypothetical protein
MSVNVSVRTDVVLPKKSQFVLITKRAHQRARGPWRPSSRCPSGVRATAVEAMG